MTRLSKRKWIIAGLCLVLALILGWYFIVVDNIADEVIVEAGGMPLASDYLIRDLGIEAEFETDLSALDLAVPGLYDVQVRYYGRSYDTHLRIRDTILPTATVQELTVFATQMPAPEAFVTEIRDATRVTVSYKDQPDMTLDGAQTVTLLLTDAGGNVAEQAVTLNVIQDSTPPVLEGVAELRYFMGLELDLLEGVIATDDLDPEPVLSVDDSAVDYGVPGTYELVYSAEDVCGNRTTQITSVTVIDDRTPPAILGAADRTLCVGSTIAYRSGIVLQDDYDESPKLTIDSSGVDLSTPGVYPLYYHAVDRAGNQSTVEISVTVKEKVRGFAEESVIYEAADKIIARIISEDMTAREQVETIYRWIQRSYFYSGHSDKTDWKQSAYDMIQSGEGDCFSFFALSKLLFERLNIPNIDVKRVRTEVHWADHYWNMVSVDGGETWYYYDATPFSSVPEEFCLVTDAYLDAFSAKYWNYYNRDRDALPATPVE